jgi:hypothetical protein
MVMVLTGRRVRPPPPCLDGVFRRVGGDEAIAAITDEVGATRLEERLTDQEVILRLEEL